MDAVPGLGEHSAKILAELGFSSLEIQGMVKANIIEKGTP